MKEILSSIETYVLVVGILFIAALVVQLYYYLVVYARVACSKSYKRLLSPEAPKPPVSVVICARNEEENLRHFLPRILEQDYPEFEVVVVNDCSCDESEVLLDRLRKEYPRLQVRTIKEDEKFSHSKKLALTVGIKAARYDWLLLTDADCIPQSDKWIATMASNFDANAGVVLGYGGYLHQKGWLNKFIRFDTLYIAMNYLGFALMGKPYMGVGRNLAYRKDLFFNNKGFASFVQLDSGDDDLFVSQVATRQNTRVDFRKDAHTRSVPRSSHHLWLQQKIRHTSTSRYYKPGVKIRLTLEPLSRFLLLASAICLVAFRFFPYWIVALVLFKLSVQLIIIKSVMVRLGERKILLVSLLWDIYSLYFYPKLLLINRFTRRKTTWR
ncbi:MAG TPA: glycosyltransferase [Tenuifilaceae bacterium]|nr:glycosyltransferase [Tenuifilaceae bacterium]